MTSITREEFAQSVDVAITAVRDFYKQLALMTKQLFDELPTEPHGLKSLGWGRMPSYPKHGEGLGIHDDYVSVWQPKALDDIDDESDDFDEPEHGDIEDEGTSKAKKKPPIEFAQAQQLLAMRIILRHPQKPDNFEPCLLYAGVGDWGIGDNDLRPSAGTPIRIASGRLRWIGRVLNKDMTEQQRLRASYKRAITTGKGKMRGRLNCTITRPVQYCGLYDLDTPQAVEQLASNMKSLLCPSSGSQADDTADE